METVPRITPFNEDSVRWECKQSESDRKITRACVFVVVVVSVRECVHVLFVCIVPYCRCVCVCVVCVC